MVPEVQPHVLARPRVVGDVHAPGAALTRLSPPLALLDVGAGIVLTAVAEAARSHSRLRARQKLASHYLGGEVSERAAAVLDAPVPQFQRVSPHPATAPCRGPWDNS